MNKNMFSGLFGLEKENVRVNKKGELAMTKHPEVFGESNPFITRDFSEAQIEMITPPQTSIKSAYNFLENIQVVVEKTLKDEFLWPQSNPPILPDDTDIPIATYNQNLEATKYRDYLKQKYGAKKSVISGIHFNLSFSDEYIRQLWDEQQSESSFVDFKNEIYLNVMRSFMYYRWFFIYLLSSSPIFHETFVAQCVDKSEVSLAGDCQLDGMKSLRSSVCGYRNKTDYQLNYETLDTFKASIQQLIASREIKQESELYQAVRIKRNDNAEAAYLEFRFIDINPYVATGVYEHDLQFIHLFALYFSQQTRFDFTVQRQEEATRNQDNMNHEQDSYLITIDGEEKSAFVAGQELLQQFSTWAEQLQEVPYPLETILAENFKRLQDKKTTFASKIMHDIKASSFIDFHLQQAETFSQKAQKQTFGLRGLEKLELSTQLLIQAAIKKGYAFDIADPMENLIKLTNIQTGKVEYVKEATKTNLDTYAQVLVMENKVVTKNVLMENGIATPKGFTVYSIDEGTELINQLPQELVIKPNTTNFGKGITIFPHGYTMRELTDGLQRAFAEDQTVLLEPFLKGLEYRFLVIDDEVVGVLNRRPANVVGNGKDTIEVLVAEKNKSFLRGEGYVRPLEKIVLGAVEQQFLQQQNLSVKSVPAAGERIFLRENSNISTGGDSIDFTDIIHPSYNEIGLQTARALGVKITGIDILIEDILQPATSKNYGVIEANFNPAIHIHTYPYKGENRYPADKILTALFEA